MVRVGTKLILVRARPPVTAAIAPMTNSDPPTVSQHARDDLRADAGHVTEQQREARAGVVDGAWGDHAGWTLADKRPCLVLWLMHEIPICHPGACPRDTVVRLPLCQRRAGQRQQVPD